jgi:hypothetical protein
MKNLPTTLPNSPTPLMHKSLVPFSLPRQNASLPPREPWSEEVHLASLTVKYWQLKCAANTNNYDTTATLADVCRLLPSTHAIVDDGSRTDKQNLNAAHRSLVHTRRDAERLRKEFLQKLRQRIALRKTLSSLSPEDTLKCINKQLRSPAQFGHIKAVLQPSTHAPLTKVHVTTTDKVTDPVTGAVTLRQSVAVIDTRAELEARILQRNQKHFAHAERTPFTELPLKAIRPDNLDQYFDDDGAPLNLSTGTFQETTVVLELLRDAFQNRPPTIEATVSFDNFVTSFLHWDEETATSPSGRHLGLYKCIVTAHIDSGSEFDDAEDAENISTQSKAFLLLHLIHDLATCVAERGMYLERWVNVVNAMIYKKNGCART